MTKAENLEKAIKLVDKLSGLAEKDRQMLRKRIPQAADGDESALADVILFPYDHNDRAIFSEIFMLILRKK